MRKLPLPSRIPILYVILGVLILLSVVPMYFYANQVMAINRDRLILNEKLLQNTITKSLGEDIANRQGNLEAMLGNLASAIQVASGGDLRNEHVSAPELRALLEKFVSSSNDIAYATLVNSEMKGISAGRIAPDDFVQRELYRAFEAAREGRVYTGQAIAVGSGAEHRVVMLYSAPLNATGVAPAGCASGSQASAGTNCGAYLGMIAAAVDLNFLVRRLQGLSQGGLLAYVVDHQGRLVASPEQRLATGQDMSKVDIVRNFVETGGKARFNFTTEFEMKTDSGREAMLGTYQPVPSLSWAVIAQKPQSEAYKGVYEIQRKAWWLAMFAVGLSILVAVYAARELTTPIKILTQSSRAIAKGDFSQRVHLTSRTEIGELAQTFNHMTEDLEGYVAKLKRAAEENKALFMGSIQMLAGAVDEKDPYTRGHSDRVTRYSVILATEMGLEKDLIETIRVSAQLHDVGKIGIEDRILKKPGALTPEEYEVMKTHTTRGANILRPVRQLKDMIPGIELHHESLDGRGYPFGLKGDEIPLIPRIITVADTFDAMTTNRPYQAAHDAEYALRIINSLANTKFDPRVVAALSSVLQQGKLRLHRAGTVAAEQAAAVAAAAAAQSSPGEVENVRS